MNIPLAEIARRIAKGEIQSPPADHYFVLASGHRFYPERWNPAQPEVSLHAARRFDNLNLVLSYGHFWAAYLPDSAEIHVRITPKEERMKKKYGFSMLELLISMLVLEVLFVMAVPNAMQLAKYAQRQGALEQVTRVRNAANTEAICAANSLPCAGVAQQIPAPGTVTSLAYTYTFTQAGGTWAYTATPSAPGNRSFYADQSGLIRYSDTGTAGPTSAPLL